MTEAGEVRRSVVGWGLLAVVVLLVFGSWIYWRGDGSVGTPDDFRRRVVETGLTVAWSNVGPRAGRGVLDTTCGPLDVAIDAIDGELWIRWGVTRERITDDTVDSILLCERD